MAVPGGPASRKEDPAILFWEDEGWDEVAQDVLSGTW